jgi:hypothetical protein
MRQIQTLCRSAIVILIGNGFSALATVYDSDGSSTNIQSIHDTLARNGDTITLPSGTFTWTTGVNITKAITLEGSTTVTGAGTSTPTVNDVTIVRDATPRGNGIVRVTLSGSQVFRMTGITFADGSGGQWASTDGAFHFISSDSTPRVRIDSCHFASLYRAKLIWNSQVYGVADHNYFEVIQNCFPFNNEGAIQGTGENGNASWADYPWFGTDKFFFIEDNTLIRPNPSFAASLVDSYIGGRWVARHNYMQDMIPSGHGTEAGAARGQRASEFYDNTVYMTVVWGGGGQRSGSSLWHDNAFTGQSSQSGTMCNLDNYRETPARGNQTPGTFTAADGTCFWDQNDTDGQGHYVEGQPPYLFDSGTVTSSTTGTFTDSTKNWSANQWVGYSIKNTTTPCAGSYIISNTSNTITFHYYAAQDVNCHLIFSVGDRYEIHRVLVMMDQNGRGRTLDHIVDCIGTSVIPNNPRCGICPNACPLWPQSQLEPCYSWNNFGPFGQVLVFGGGQEPTSKPGIDFFNLLNGFPQDTTPSQVSSFYTESVNGPGAPYVHTFCYPHPLTGGVCNASPTPTPTATPTATPTPTPTLTPTPTPTLTPTPTPTLTPTPTPSPTPTATPTATPTPRPSSTPTATPRPTATATPTPRHTPRPHPSHAPG